MPVPTPDRIRTVAVIGHSHDGKTTLCEALLHVAGATPRMGATEQGTSILDHEPEEQRRSMSIGAALAHLDWEGHRVNLIDVPGFQDFAGELAAALTAADAAVLVVGAGGSVPVGAELAWEMVVARHLPALIVVNKMDKENAGVRGDGRRAARGLRPQARGGGRAHRQRRRLHRLRRPRQRQRAPVRGRREGARRRAARGDAHRGGARPQRTRRRRRRDRRRAHREVPRRHRAHRRRGAWRAAHRRAAGQPGADRLRRRR